MKKIASFTVNHDLLDRGVYVSRIDGDAVTCTPWIICLPPMSGIRSIRMASFMQVLWDVGRGFIL